MDELRKLKGNCNEKSLNLTGVHFYYKIIEIMSTKSGLLHLISGLLFSPHSYYIFIMCQKDY